MSCNESEELIPPTFNENVGLIKGQFTRQWTRKNIITRFCWSCWHVHKHGVYQQGYLEAVSGHNTAYICSACGKVDFR